MKNNIRTLLITLLIFPSFILSGSEMDDINAIRDAANTWIKYYEAGDLNNLMDLYMEDAYVALHGQSAMRGKQTIKDFFAPSMGKSDVVFEIDIEEIQIHGDTAHLISKYWFTAVSKSDGSVYKDTGRSLLIYKRDTDKKWKIYTDIDQLTPDAFWPN